MSNAKLLKSVNEKIKIKKPTKSTKSKKNMDMSIEKPTSSSSKGTYQKLSQLEHVLLRADMYVGSKEPDTIQLYVPVSTDSSEYFMELKTITYVPAFYKIFDEILVNAADNKIRDQSMDTIKVTVDKKSGEISVFNNGKGIPVEVHETENIYIPEMIFGHLLTSSNFDDDEKKITGGRNGYGAKLTNIYSTEFTVETHDGNVGKTYKQKWKNNMSTKLPYKINNSTKKNDFTKVTFCPDFTRLNMSSNNETHDQEKIPDDVFLLLRKRVFDLTATLRGIKVFFNGERIKISSFKDYVSMYLIDSDDKNIKKDIIYEKPNERWEVAVTLSDTGTFKQISFVNSIATLKGGTHVSHVVDQIISYLVEQIRKKDKNATVKPAQIKNQLFLFINCLIENPSFDSQTKETMTLRPTHFGSTCNLSDTFMKKIVKLGVLETTMALLKEKDFQQLQKSDGQKRSRLTGIVSLSDANNAGTKKSKECTLFLTEGVSAKSFAMTGIPVVRNGRDIYGAFPLRGKLLNVRDASTKQKLENAEISQLKQILGLKEGKTYSSVDELRYGHICALVDADDDGKHIKGLIINWLESCFPSLLQIPGFLLDFRSPIVKCEKGKEKMLFYTLRDYNNWKSKNQNSLGWKIKYFKGLGTSKAEDIKIYFGKIDNHLKRFHELTEDDSEKLDMVFSKKRAMDRKVWLKNYNKDNILNDGDSIISIADFIDKDFIEFSMYDNIRSIPSVIDGLKPGQRKILYTALKTKLNNDMKVAQFGAKVAEMTEYRHGEQSLFETIIGMAQDFVGANNIPLLEQEGCFGTRLQGGNDAASPRYIYTRLRKETRMIFHESDDAILTYLKEDGLLIEPKYYIPVIPMVLINGAEGIGSGYSTHVPSYNPKDIIEWLLKRNELSISTISSEILPWYKGFKGSVREEESGRIAFEGLFQINYNDLTIKITELPVHTWTEKYKELLEAMIVTGDLKDYKEYHTDTDVSFVLKATSEGMKKIEKDPLKVLKLVTTQHTTNMILFSSDGFLKKYDSVQQILEEFYQLRIKTYEKRKAHILTNLKELLKWAQNKVRFIQYLIEGKLKLDKRLKKDILYDLKQFSFDEKDDSGYNYLINMPLHSLSEEKINEFSLEKDRLQTLYDDLFKKDIHSMYSEDLELIKKEIL